MFDLRNFIITDCEYRTSNIALLSQKQKATALRNDLLNLFLDGKKKKLTDIGFGFLGFYWNWLFG